MEILPPISQKAPNGTKQPATPFLERSNFTIGESESDTESDKEESRTQTTSANAPARITNIIKELEIERLSNDL